MAIHTHTTTAPTRARPRPATSDAAHTPTPPTCRRATRGTREDTHPYRFLPFVRSPDTGGRDFWAVASTGDPNLDLFLGRALGEAAVRYIRSGQDGAADLLRYVAGDMVREGHSPFVAVGFMGEVGRALAASATVLRVVS